MSNNLWKPSQLAIGGFFPGVEVRDILGQLLRTTWAKNGITNAGLNNLLDTYFGAGTWYFGLINNSGFSTLAAADTMSSHSGWAELTTYSQATRPQWVPDAASGQSITNSTLASFTMTGTVAVVGAFVTSNSTKGGSTGTLWATGLFNSVQNLTSGQILRLPYTLSAAGA